MTLRDLLIVLVHALLFYCVCQAFVDIANSTAPIDSDLSRELAARFTFFYVGLLLLNSIWLLAGFGRKDASTAEGIWGWNNLVAVALAVVVWVLFQTLSISPPVYIAITGAIFVANSVIDLWLASEHYILFPKRTAGAERA